MKKNKKGIYIILAVVVIITAAVAFFVGGRLINGTPTTSEVKSHFSLITEPIEAEDIEFADINGKVYRLSEFEGKNVVVNFWAVFCPPCVEELPDFDKAVAELEDMNTIIIALNVVESPDEVKQFIDKIKIKNLDVYFDINQNSSIAYAIDTIPRTIIIDAKGYIRAVARGAVTYEDLIDTVDKVR